ncbi:ABC transporter ATP-binding protein [Plantibacter sp. YIM 135347]|uniref:ABC transporter ATP-binding protein n=1 Tax=Plantibacter sp. YIM 135347 TaxID=3423919 RepID=UPI003D32E697
MSQQLLPIASGRQALTGVSRIIRAHLRRFVGMLSLHALTVGLTVLSPLLFGLLLDTLTGTQSADVGLLFVGICAALLARTLFTWLSQRSSFGFGEAVFSQLRDETITGIVKLPMRTVEEASRGDVLSRTSNDIDAVSDGVRVGLPEVLVGVLSTVFTLTVSFLLDWRIALASLIGLPVLVISTRWFVKRSQPAYERELEAHADYDASVLETIEGLRTIHTHRLGGPAVARIHSTSLGVNRSERHTLRLQTIWFPLVQMAYYLPFAAVVVWGGILVVNGEASMGTVIAIALNVQLIVDPLDDLLYWTDQLQLASAAFKRILGIARPIDPAVAASQAQTEKANNADLVFEDVTFSYRDGRVALKKTSVSIAHGERVMLVGKSGAGKSTFALLAAGIYPPDTGRVFVPGTGAARVMIVTQEQYVFTGTLAENLRLAAPMAHDQDLIAALTTVGAEDLLELASGDLDADLDADELSSADRQRIALARVVLSDPRIVILDEATAALSLHDEANIERALMSAMKGRTVITVAHRMQSAPLVDRVIVMEDGAIVEDGPHTELTHAGGLYASMWRSWNTDHGEANADEGRRTNV